MSAPRALRVVAVALAAGCGSSAMWSIGEARARTRADAPLTSVSPSKHLPPGPPVVGEGRTRSPTSAPLLSGAGRDGDDESEAGGSPAAETDPLVRNGLGSPLCSGAPGGVALAGAGRRNCETSGFVAAAAPTGNFGLDVHIDTGLLGLSSAGLLAIVQDLFIAPLWMALVWAMHALVVVLEWCFTIDLLDGETLRGGVATTLRTMQSSITRPWLALVLPLAAVLCAYHGLVRRRVAESLAQAVLVLVMTATCIWVTIDPADTVGALGEWANGASLGTLAVTARGSPASPGNALAESVGVVFGTAVEVPWCYLEFGDVDWCRSPARLDPGLRAAALRLAASEQREAACTTTRAPGGCEGHSGAEAEALERSARLLRAARTNGEMFLALPPNGPARNAINDPSSLLRAICRSQDATDCHGQAAAAAEFRTNHGTWPRVGGLLLIAGGVLGLLLLLGFVSLRLLGAAIFSLLYLLLAPAVALAPALGEPGRAAFRKWVAQLLGAVVSKLLFAFLLGVLLTVIAIVSRLEVGWWTRWLLMSAFWWGTFSRRHQLLQLIGGDRAALGGWKAPRRPGDAPNLGGRARERLRAARERSDRKPPEPDRRGGRLSLPGSGLPNGGRGRLAGATPRASGSVKPASADREQRAAAAVAPEVMQAPIEGSARAHAQKRLQSIGEQEERATAVGNTRRAALLASRGRRVAAELARDSEGGERGVAATTAERSARHARFLEDQAQLPPLGFAGSESQVRSYAALAGIAGYGRREYLQLDPVKAFVARQQIDRELALRREAGPGIAGVDRGGLMDGAAARRGRHRPKPAPRRPKPARPASVSPSESIVMRDARDVAAGRKRQLGKDNP